MTQTACACKGAFQTDSTLDGCRLPADGPQGQPMGVSQCLSSNSQWTCPAGVPPTVGNKTADYVSAAGVTCKVCDVSSPASVLDLDGRAGKVHFFVSFGGLMNVAGDYGVQSYVKSYSVHVVDAMGRKVGTAMGMAMAGKSSSCCNNKEYTAVVKGDFASGSTSLMIVPDFFLRDSMGRILRDSATVDLPMGELITIVDVEGVATVTVTGSFDATVSDTAAALASPEFKEAATEGIATNAGVDKGLVSITKMTAVVATADAGGRRLGQPARRLAEGKIKIEYEIIIPEGVTGVDAASVAGKMANVETLGAAMTASVSKAAIPGVTVTAVSGAVAVEETLVDPPPEGSTGGAQRQSGVFAVVVAALALVGMLQ